MEDTIAAIATAAIDSAIAVIRLSGPRAHEIAGRVFKPRQGVFADMAVNQMRYGAFYDAGGRLLDEGMAVRLAGPRSYTGEDGAEFYTHGGVVVSAMVYSALLAAGARAAEAGEYTRRAFLNGKMDLTKAEAVIDLIHAQSEAAAASAAVQLSGGLYEKIAALEALLLDADSTMMAVIDFPEEGLAPPDLAEIRTLLSKASAGFERLAAGFTAGQALKEGIPTAIIGRPNAGKSSLMNLLCGRKRSIVTDIPGTTRDVVAHTAPMGPFLLRLADTAGIRATDDVIEREGVKLAGQMAKEASLILAVFDGAAPLSWEDDQVMALCAGKRAIALVNKEDLGIEADLDRIRAHFKHVLPFSALTGAGLEELRRLVSEIYAPAAGLDLSEAIVTSKRHAQLLSQAKDEIDQALAQLDFGATIDLVANMVEEGMRTLGKITGKTVSEEVIDTIFSRFCVGK